MYIILASNEADGKGNAWAYGTSHSGLPFTTVEQARIEAQALKEDKPGFTFLITGLHRRDPLYTRTVEEEVAA